MNSVLNETETIRKKTFFSFVISFLLIVFAFILLFREEDFISTFVLILGFFFLIFSCFSFVKYFHMEKGLKAYSNSLFEGILFFVFGIIAILKSETLAGMLTYLLGAYLIYKNASRLQFGMHLKYSTGKTFWNFMSIISILGILFGTFIVLNPLDGKVSITTVIAICILISEIIYIFQSIAILIGMKKSHE